MKNADIQTGQEYVIHVFGAVPQYRQPVFPGIVRVLDKNVEMKTGQGWRSRTIKTGVEVEFIEKYGVAYKRGAKAVFEPRRFFMKHDEWKEMKVAQETRRVEEEQYREARKQRVGDLNQKFADAGYDLHFGSGYGRRGLMGDLDEIERLASDIETARQGRNVFILRGKGTATAFETKFIDPHREESH